MQRYALNINLASIVCANNAKIPYSLTHIKDLTCINTSSRKCNYIAGEYRLHNVSYGSILYIIRYRLYTIRYREGGETHLWRYAHEVLTLGKAKKIIVFFCFSLTYSYLCLRKHEDNKHHHQDTDASCAGRSDTLLDVSWGKLARDATRYDRRNGLDVDASLLSFRHTCTDVQRVEMASNARTNGRAPSPLRQHSCRFPILCSLTHRAARGRVYSLRRVEALRQHLIS